MVYEMASWAWHGIWYGLARYGMVFKEQVSNIYNILESFPGQGRESHKGDGTTGE